MQHVVIGAGEVGQAIAEVLAPYGPHLRDVEHTGPPEADVLHICFPWGGAFEEQVTRYEVQYQPRMVIVHSTVMRGTCDPHAWVHSPVTGRHPHLADSIRTFTKYFGGVQAHTAAQVFAELGIATTVTPRAATTEAGKLWELTQYGLAIIVEQQIHAYCEKHGIDYDVAYRQMAETYNVGYQDLGLPQFTRPVLDYMPGPIGGHCVLPGAEMLDHWIGRMVALEGSARPAEWVLQEVIA